MVEKRSRASVQQIVGPAFMVNRLGEIVWINEQARKGLAIDCLSGELSKRNIQLFLGERSNQQDWYGELGSFLKSFMTERLDEDYGLIKIEWHTMVYALRFREGALVLFDSSLKQTVDIRKLLGSRKELIHDLERRKLPSLVDMAIVVADLQNSSQLCCRMMPFDYFQLIAEINRKAVEIFSKGGGVYGKHVGDGIFYYFFKQGNNEYLYAAAKCAALMRKAIKDIEQEWQARKGMECSIQLNIGINEGREWIGVSSSPQNELMALGDSVNIGATLSEIARDGAILMTKNVILSMPEDLRSKVSYGVKNEDDSTWEGGFTQVKEYSRKRGIQVREELFFLPITEVMDVI